MVYKLCKRQIEQGNIDGMQDKLDVFLLNNRITLAQYEELVSMLPKVDEVKDVVVDNATEKENV